MVYYKDTLIGTAGGRKYYKATDGFALAGAGSGYNGVSAVFFLVGKEENTVSRILYL